MRLNAPSPLPSLAVGIALLRGVAEFVALLRWRLKAVLAGIARGS